jgi:hypothetical protein
MVAKKKMFMRNEFGPSTKKQDSLFDMEDDEREVQVQKRREKARKESQRMRGWRASRSGIAEDSGIAENRPKNLPPISRTTTQRGTVLILSGGSPTKRGSSVDQVVFSKNRSVQKILMMEILKKDYELIYDRVATVAKDKMQHPDGKQGEFAGNTPIALVKTAEGSFFFGNEDKKVKVIINDLIKKIKRNHADDEKAKEDIIYILKFLKTELQDFGKSLFHFIEEINKSIFKGKSIVHQFLAFVEGFIVTSLPILDIYSSYTCAKILFDYMNLEMSIDKLKRAKFFAEKELEYKMKMKIYYQLALCFKTMTKNRTALIYAQRALELAWKEKSRDYEIYCYDLIGKCYFS